MFSLFKPKPRPEYIGHTQEYFVDSDLWNPLEIAHAFRVEVVSHSEDLFLTEKGAYFKDRIGASPEPEYCNPAIHRLALSAIPLAESVAELKSEARRLSKFQLVSTAGRTEQDFSSEVDKVNQEIERIEKALIALYHQLVQESELIHIPEGANDEVIQKAKDRATYIESLLDTFEQEN